MKNPDSAGTADMLKPMLGSLKQIAFRSEACFRGTEWMRAKLADLKIDLWLATEQGEQEESSEQVKELRIQIERLTLDLQPSIFSTKEGDPKLLIMAAAADTARMILCILSLQPFMQSAGRERLITGALAFSQTRDAQKGAASALRRLEKPHITIEDTRLVLDASRTLIRNLLASPSPAQEKR